MSVVSFAEARHIVEQHARDVKPSVIETVPLLEARQRVLAEPLLADRDFPPFPRATRDGYAVRAADLATLPVRLRVVGEIKAGIAAELISLHPGEAAEIMTGAPVPSGADAVVMVEYTSRRGDVVEIQRGVSAGENIVPQGAEARAGDPLLAPGTRLDYAAVAVAAGIGKTQVRVYAKPKVAILGTGDELVDISARPAANQIRNSNSASLAAQVAAAGARPFLLPIARDNPDDLRRLIARGLAADLLVLSGGVSMGKYDLVEPALAELHAEFFFTGALIQPGRPVVFGRARAQASAEAGITGTYFFGLPGNPLSTMVTFELFVRPMLEALAGAVPRPLLFPQARLKSELKTKTGLTRFLPAQLSGEFERCEVEPVRWQGSGDVAASARSNCYLVVPPDREVLHAGEMVSVLLKA